MSYGMMYCDMCRYIIPLFITIQQLTGQKVTADHAADILNKKFSTHEPRRDPIVLLVDEVCSYSDFLVE